MNAELKQKLEQMCHQFRIDVLTTLHAKQTGHPGGSLSVCEILTTLYFAQMNVDPKDPQKADRDRLVLCKGHAAPMLYRVLAEKGFFPVEELLTHCQNGSRLSGHVSHKGVPGVEASTGSLGQGMPMAMGMAMAAKLNHEEHRVYCIIGDGECDEEMCIRDRSVTTCKFSNATFSATPSHRFNCMNPAWMR